MFSRNRSAQLLELPLLSRFAADLRRHTRAFAYKPPHKIHNTSPRRAIPTEDIHRSREFMQNRGGDSLADRRFSKQNPSSSHSLAPFSSLASGKYREAFALIPGTCTAIATKKGMSERETTNAPTKVRRKKRRKGLKKKERRGSPHFSCGETRKNRGILPNKWRLSAKNSRLLSVEVGETRSRLAVRYRIRKFAHNLTPQQIFP